METLAAENPVDETPENMHDQEHTDERSDDTYSEGSIDEDSGRLVDPDYHSEDPEDLADNSLSTHAGESVDEGKKRTSWERKSTTNNFQQKTSKTNDTDRVHKATQLPTSLVRTTKANPNNEFNKAREGEEEGSQSNFYLHYGWCDEDINVQHHHWFVHIVYCLHKC